MASQPRFPGATAAHLSAAAKEFERQLKEAGFTDVRIETRCNAITNTRGRGSPGSRPVWADDAVTESGRVATC